jgi:hypothetical protein
MDQQHTPQKGTALEQMVLYRMNSIDDALRALTQQVGRLVLIEERQTKTSEAMERAFADLRAHDARIKTLELTQPITARTNVWVERAVIAVVSALGAVLLKLALAT